MHAFVVIVDFFISIIVWNRRVATRTAMVTPALVTITAIVIPALGILTVLATIIVLVTPATTLIKDIICLRRIRHIIRSKCHPGQHAHDEAEGQKDCQ